MVTPAQLATMLVDWTDPQKAVYVPEFVPACISDLIPRAVANGMRESAADDALHIDLANDIVKTLFKQDMTSECSLRQHCDALIVLWWQRRTRKRFVSS